MDMSEALGVDWQLSAALLSRPINLQTVVSLSIDKPQEFDEKILTRLVNLLNDTNTGKIDRSGKEDVLKILSNLAKNPRRRNELQEHIMRISDWFEKFIVEQEGSRIPSEIRMLSDIEEPRLHKMMLILLSRVYDYRLRSEDLLELTNEDTVLALATVIGVLEEGYSYVSQIKQRQAPQEGQKAQWEHGVMFMPHESELILQCCRLLRGFTHPQTYFGNKGVESVTPFSVEEFRMRINQLLALTLDAELVDKMVSALHDCMFNEQRKEGSTLDYTHTEHEDTVITLNSEQHLALLSVSSFLHNLYLYANQAYLPLYRQHLLLESPLIDDMILPYLAICLRQASELSAEPTATFDTETLLVKGIAACFKLLIIATFRVPWLSSGQINLWKLSGHTLLVACTPFLQRHETILALLVLFDINIGALEVATDRGAEEAGKSKDVASESKAAKGESMAKSTESTTPPDSCQPQTILKTIGDVFRSLLNKQQKRVLSLVENSGQLPVSRDVASYAAVCSVMYTIYIPAETSEIVAESKPDSKAEAKQTKGEGTTGCEDKSGPKAESKKSESAFRLLGDLPSLPGRRGESLAGNSRESSKEKKVIARKMMSERVQLPPQKKAPQKNHSSVLQHVTQEVPSGVPKQFLCAINGHILKEPVRSKYGHNFEKATIELWQSQQGSVCPLTGRPLSASDLEENKDLKSQIELWHIQQVLGNTTAGDDNDDDLYDF